MKIDNQIKGYIMGILEKDDCCNCAKCGIDLDFKGRCLHQKNDNENPVLKDFELICAGCYGSR